MSIETVEITSPGSFSVVEVRQGPAGTGGGGSNSVTSATTSDGTADLDLLNVTTATAEITGTLTANHIHGNLAGSVYAHVRAGEALLKGDPVYVSGFNNGTSTAEVSKADASNAAKMPAIGIMDANLAHNATGHMVVTGVITDLNTAGYSINAELYVAAGGGMTATPPTARAQPVARVERSNLNNGAILVKVNGLSASDATASTLVRRTSTGGTSFVGVDVTTLTAAGISTTGQVEFNGTDAGDSLTFNMVNYAYGTGAASAHRTALGSGATGDELFTRASPAAARETTLNEILKYDPNAAATRTNPATQADDDVLTGINLTAGIWEIHFHFSFNVGSGGVIPNILFGTPSSVDLANGSIPGNYQVINQAIQYLAFNSTTGVMPLQARGSNSNVNYTGQFTVNLIGATSLSMTFARNTDVALSTIIRRAGAFLRARKING